MFYQYFAFRCFLSIQFFLLIVTIVIPNYGIASECKKVTLPVRNDAFGLPKVEIEINGTRYKALLDLGSADALHIPTKLASQMTGFSYTGDSVKSSNLLGKEVEQKSFVIKQFSLGCMTFHNLQGIEFLDWSVSKGEMSEQQREEYIDPKNQLVIGRQFFKGKVVSFDFSNNKIEITDSLIPVEGGESFDIKEQVEGISIEVNTAINKYSMVLDSGSNISILSVNKVKKNEPVESCNIDLGGGLACQKIVHNLKIGNKLPYESNVMLLPIDPRFSPDGLLGADFFNAFYIQLDISSRQIYLKRY